MESISKEGIQTLYSKENPFLAKLVENYKLNKEGSSKDTRHIVFDLEDSGLHYLPGDSLYIVPENDPALVKELLSFLDLDYAEDFEFNRFLKEINITRPSNKLFTFIASKTSADGKLLGEELLGYSTAGVLKAIKEKYPDFSLTSNELVENSSKVLGRAYSIASSLNAHPRKVELCISRVDALVNNQRVLGLCSNYISDRVPLNENLTKIYLHTNDKFRLPQDSSLDIIMVGPGTGIAPFRAFIEERNYLRESGKKVGRDWLFFGDQKSEYDYLYGEELETYRRDFNLSLDLAFSRDQDFKVYVQDRMKEKSEEIFRWLENGAHFYVCGDARKMAKDVDTALREIVAEHGKDPDSYITELKNTQRYSRDVY
jgi:sulfite reductase (NADPH) flavoprotein alpha-component